LLTQFFTNFVLGFIVKSLYGNNKLLLDGMDPRCLITMLKEAWQSIHVP